MAVGRRSHSGQVWRPPGHRIRLTCTVTGHWTAIVGVPASELLPFAGSIVADAKRPPVTTPNRFDGYSLLKRMLASASMSLTTMRP